jgi:hypothetical protein
MAPETLSSLPRRQFLAACAAIPALGNLVAWAKLSFGAETSPADSSLDFQRLPEADLAREVESLLKFVDPKLLDRYAPIDPAKNAWPLWKQAKDAFVAEPAQEDFYSDIEKFRENPINVTAKTRKRIETWVEQNKNCRKLTDDGIERGLYELPRAKKSVWLEIATEEATLPRELARVKSSYALICLSRGDFKAAFDEAASILKMGTMLAQAECLIIDYFIARAIMGEGMQAILKIAMSRSVPEPLARRAIDQLSAANPKIELLKQAYRVEVCRWMVPWIAEFRQQGEATEMAKCFLGGPFAGDLLNNGQTKQNYQRAVRQAAILLEGHPDPIDKPATVKLASEIYAHLLDELDRPYLKRTSTLSESLKKEVSAWPEGVSANAWIMPGSAANQAARKLDDKELRKLNQQLRSVKNLVGKLMLADNSSELKVVPEMHDARLEAVRLRIALRLYKKQHGNLPAKLDDLVSAKLLPTVPIDPFDGGPFRYSPERGVIWCLGKDGKNDGINSESPAKSDFDEDINLTWRIAPPAAT